MKQKLSLENWARKDHFDFFSRFEEPFFGVTVNIDCSKAYSFAKSSGFSFFLYYMHASLRAANNIEPFRYRIEGNEVFVHDTVNASPTINRADGTFGFAYMDYHEDFETFAAIAQKEIDAVQQSKGLIPSISGQNVIHYSSIPWVSFSSLSHARAFAFKDSIPKISFGKMTNANGVRTMPVSIHVHHGLLDGYHVGQFIDLFQNIMNK